MNPGMKVSSCMNLGDLVQKLIFQDGVSGHLLFGLLVKIPGIFGRDTGAKKSQLESPRLKNVSPGIQNDVIGKGMIQESILSEVRKATFFSIMVDEISSFNKEIMPLCVRYVNSNKEVKEEFLKYSYLTRITGKAIAENVLDSLKQLDLDVKNVGGQQGYDGASNMSSARVGLQALIRVKSPLAVYTNCTGHCLNLVIGGSCPLPIIMQ